MKGQAAIEYITTYGWAILLLVIVIGIIASTFSPSFLIAEQCNIDKNTLPCNSQMYNSGEDLIILVEVFNGFGYPIKIENGDIDVKDGNGDSASVISLGTTGIVEPGESFIVKALFPDEKKPVNTLVTVTAEVNYQSCAPEINPDCSDPDIGKHIKSGKIVGRVITD